MYARSGGAAGNHPGRVTHRSTVGQHHEKHSTHAAGRWVDRRDVAAKFETKLPPSERLRRVAPGMDVQPVADWGTRPRVAVVIAGGVTISAVVMVAVTAFCQVLVSRVVLACHQWFFVAEHSRTLPRYCCR